MSVFASPFYWRIKVYVCVLYCEMCYFYLEMFPVAGLHQNPPGELMIQLVLLQTPYSRIKWRSNNGWKETEMKGEWNAVGSDGGKVA